MILNRGLLLMEVLPVCGPAPAAVVVGVVLSVEVGSSLGPVSADKGMKALESLDLLHRKYTPLILPAILMVQNMVSVIVPTTPGLIALVLDIMGLSSVLTVGCGLLVINALKDRTPAQQGIPAESHREFPRHFVGKLEVNPSFKPRKWLFD